MTTHHSTKNYYSTSLTINQLNINLKHKLNKFFGLQQFRPQQEKIIHTILNKRDVLALLPTGAGKSICFQLPALINKLPTIVITPLISLMEDQVYNLNKRNIPAITIHSGSLNNLNTILNMRKIIANHKLIYLSPEKFTNPKLIDTITQQRFATIVIDEAHCVSMWGHDFRPSYQRIAQVVKQIQSKPNIAAFTATATPAVIQDIKKLLQLNNPLEFRLSVIRRNIFIESVYCYNQKEKELILLYILNKYKNQAGIIYCSTRTTTFYVSKLINHFFNKENSKQQFSGYYHANLANIEKEQTQTQFLNDKMKVIVATNAFGMGIDKSNIRFVIHFQLPSNIENYYQEIGRAGRDGLHSHCYLLFQEKDAYTQQQLIQSQQQIVTERKKYLLQKLIDMIKFAQSKTCLHQQISKYFGECQKQQCINNCSNCTNKKIIKESSFEQFVLEYSYNHDN